MGTMSALTGHIWHSRAVKLASSARNRVFLRSRAVKSAFSAWNMVFLRSRGVKLAFSAQNRVFMRSRGVESSFSARNKVFLHSRGVKLAFSAGDLPGKGVICGKCRCSRRGTCQFWGTILVSVSPKGTCQPWYVFPAGGDAWRCYALPREVPYKRVGGRLGGSA